MDDTTTLREQLFSLRKALQYREELTKKLIEELTEEKEKVFELEKQHRIDTEKIRSLELELSALQLGSIEGHLSLRRGNKWQKVWAKIIHKYLYFFSNQVDGVLLGHIDLREATIRNGSSEQFTTSKFTFELKLKDDTFLFGAKTDHDKNKWLGSLELTSGKRCTGESFDPTASPTPTTSPPTSPPPPPPTPTNSMTDLTASPTTDTTSTTARVSKAPLRTFSRKFPSQEDMTSLSPYKRLVRTLSYKPTKSASNPSMDSLHVHGPPAESEPPIRKQRAHTHTAGFKSSVQKFFKKSEPEHTSTTDSNTVYSIAKNELFHKIKEKWDKPSAQLPVFVDFPRVVQNVRCYDEQIKKIDHETEAARELEEKKEAEAKLRASADTQSNNSNTSDNTTTTTTADQSKDSTSNGTSNSTASTNESTAIQQTSTPQDSDSTKSSEDTNDETVNESATNTSNSSDATTTASVKSPRERKKKSRKTANNVTNSEESSEKLQKTTDSSETTKNNNTETTEVPKKESHSKSNADDKDLKRSKSKVSFNESSDNIPERPRLSSKTRKKSLKELNLKVTLSEEQVTVLKESEASESSSNLTPKNQDKKQSSTNSPVVEAKVESTPALSAEELASRERSKSSDAVKVQKMRDYLYVFGRRLKDTAFLEVLAKNFFEQMKLEGDLSTSLRAFFVNNSVMESKTCRLLKLLTQAMIAPPYMSLRERFAAVDFPITDVHKWLIQIVFRKREIVIVHSKKAKSKAPPKTPDYFEFIWHLQISVDTEVTTLRDVQLSVTNLETNEQMEKIKKNKLKNICEHRLYL